eukprot:gene9309-10275_t
MFLLSWKGLNKTLGKSGTAYVYALGLCIMNGKQVTTWHKGKVV